MGETFFVRKFTHFNYISKIKALDKEIVRLLKGENSYMALREYGYTFGSPQYLYIYFRDVGSFKSVSDMLAEYVEYTEFSNGCGIGGDSLALAEYALETGNFDDVELDSLMAIEKAETMSQTSVVICAKFCLIRLRVVQGKLPEALELLEQLQRKVEPLHRSLYNATLGPVPRIYFRKYLPARTGSVMAANGRYVCR